MSEVEDRVYNIELALKEIEKFPQTYESLLQGEASIFGSTLRQLLNKKLNRLVKEGRVFKTAIPGTRFGKAIFYAYPKKYSLLVEAGRTGSNVFVFFESEKVDRYYMRVKDCWALTGGFWKKLDEEKIFFEGNILLLI